MGTPEQFPASLDDLFKTAVALDNSPHVTEEMAQHFFAKAGVLPLIENKYVFADFRKQLKKLQASGGIRKQYDIGKNVEEFTITRVSDNVEIHCLHNVNVTIQLIGQDRPDAQYVLGVEYGVTGIPDFLAIAHASCCTVQVGCSVRESKHLKGLIFIMPVELAEEEQVHVQVRWTLSLDAYQRFLKVTGKWLCNYKPAASARKEKRALKLMHGRKTRMNAVLKSPHAPQDVEPKDAGDIRFQELKWHKMVMKLLERELHRM